MATAFVRKLLIVLRRLHVHMCEHQPRYTRALLQDRPQDVDTTTS